MFRRVAAVFALLLCACAAAAFAQADDQSNLPMALRTESRDFIAHADAGLTFLGNPLRFGGINIEWLGLFDQRYPTDYETHDILATVQDLGSGYVRALSLGSSVGCARCLMPSPGQYNADAFAHFDHVLKAAHDDGIRLTIPLTGNGQNCGVGPLDPVSQSSCVFARWAGHDAAAFFTDPGVRANFLKYVTAILTHVNAETGIAYRDDPTIMAWENCDGCGHGVDPAMLSAWTEAVGEAIKSIDTHHLYENGAFAGQLTMTKAAQWATPSVDIVGDRIEPGPSSPSDLFVPALQAVTSANRVYMVDSYAWLPSNWTMQDDFQAFLDSMRKHRILTGAFVSTLSGHAQGGGYLPVTPGQQVPLFFPGTQVAGIDEATMEARARAVRRFSYRMMDLPVSTFAQPDQPEIISVVAGRITWRGVAGASKYSIERSTDLTQRGSWSVVCDECVTDAHPSWRDPSPPAGPVWYRVTPFNANRHFGLPSDPVQNR